MRRRERRVERRPQVMSDADGSALDLLLMAFLFLAPRSTQCVLSLQ